MEKATDSKKDAADDRPTRHRRHGVAVSEMPENLLNRLRQV